MTVIEYIKTSIEILMNMRADDQKKDITGVKKKPKSGIGKFGALENEFSTFIADPPEEYEEVIQKLELDVRKHIRTQNQLKLHIES